MHTEQDPERHFKLHAPVRPVENRPSEPASHPTTKPFTYTGLRPGWPTATLHATGLTVQSTPRRRSLLRTLDPQGCGGFPPSRNSIGPRSRSCFPASGLTRDHLQSPNPVHAQALERGDKIPSRPGAYPPTSAYSSIGGHAQTRLRSPDALSMRPTAGQNLCSRVHGAGNAACSRP